MRSPVWTLEWRARWPLVVKARSQVGQTCFFLGAGAAAAGVGEAGESWGEGLAESDMYWEWLLLGNWE